MTFPAVAAILLGPIPLLAAAVLLWAAILAIGVPWPVVVLPVRAVLLLPILILAVAILTVRRMPIAGLVRLSLVVTARLVGGLRRRGNRRRRRRRPLARRGETLGQAVEIVVTLVVLLDLLAGLALIAELRLLLRQLRRCDQPKIMFGMLKVAFRHHGVAGRLRIPGELQVLFADVMRRPPDLHVGSIRLIRAG